MIRGTIQVPYIHKFLFVAISAAIFILGCGSESQESQLVLDTQQEQWVQNFVSIKYRSDPVDVAAPYFEKLERSDSSMVLEAWFDSNNQYLVINLVGTNYHYCSLPNVIWDSLKAADSMGTYFQSSIKGGYDCRIHPVPIYP